MSPSNPKLKSTKAGVALSAAARKKLQHVATWMALELKGNQDRTIRLGHHGGVASYTENNVTFLSAFGVLVQIFQPFKLSEMKYIDRGVYISNVNILFKRTGKILGISISEVQLLSYYINRDSYFSTTVKQLRTLK